MLEGLPCHEMLRIANGSVAGIGFVVGLCISNDLRDDPLACVVLAMTSTGRGHRGHQRAIGRIAITGLSAPLLVLALGSPAQAFYWIGDKCHGSVGVTRISAWETWSSGYQLQPAVGPYRLGTPER